jgi:hypothetical protein
MAYTNPLDPNVPTDATLGYQIDDAIRVVVAALLERFGTVFKNWPDGDPLELRDAIINDPDQLDALLKLNAANLPGGAFTTHITTLLLAGVTIAAGATHTVDLTPAAFGLTTIETGDTLIARFAAVGGSPAASLHKLVLSAIIAEGPPTLLRIGLFNPTAGSITFSGTPPFEQVHVTLLRHL